ncbi:hypothetical protein [Marinobacter xestospongiae]|uniref:Uncharacterized protein n=1 Tax=Marinobacter xestospongiae TaxID=994319 RepID=A0ABU3W1H2_9GAMM|nr:hypothetical protein [Marinobacter xestospongiae]MDV2080384.1 hypothetical protein [Marinobacter xestospongiae]
MNQHENFTELTKKAAAFDKLLPDHPAQLENEPRRIIATTPSVPYVIAEEPTNPFHKIIFRALATAFQTPWFNGLAPRSQTGHLVRARQFFDWINKTRYLTTEDNRYSCLKDFEAHRMNVDGIKCSPLVLLRTAIEMGLGAESLSKDQYHYLRTLLRVSNISREPEPEPITLTDWIDLPWLRSLLGEQQYLSLESPSRLFSSFRITVATTLTYLLEIRTEWKRRAHQTYRANNQKEWVKDWDSRLIRDLGRFDGFGEPADEFTELLWLDMVADHERPNLKSLVAQRGAEYVVKQPTYPKRFYPWRRPVIFHPDSLLTYSLLEEILMAWLVACETVQPTDIPKLKTTDYAREYNSAGRLIAMQCCYYKGRAGTTREPAMLIASDCWTKAQFAYLKGLPDSAPLFQHNITRQIVFPDFGHVFKSKKTNSPQSTFFLLLQTPQLQARIRAAVKRAGASPIFLNAFLGLTQGGQSHNHFLSKNKGGSRSDYEAAVPRPLPFRMFSLTHIKNTAVHAGSDLYRDGDLINHHSHTSATEKHHYLTDANKDFVNRAGRITRMVLQDLQNVVYQPSVSVIKQAVNDMELRSQVVEATGSTDARVKPLNVITGRPDNGDVILVPDTIEQALIFIHSIAQVEEKYQQLLHLRPDWVEQTLLPHLEWMVRTLTKMRSASEAQGQYLGLKNHLPPIFDHLLETHE